MDGLPKRLASSMLAQVPFQSSREIGSEHVAVENEIESSCQFRLSECTESALGSLSSLASYWMFWDRRRRHDGPKKNLRMINI